MAHVDKTAVHHVPGQRGKNGTARYREAAATALGVGALVHFKDRPTRKAGVSRTAFKTNVLLALARCRQDNEWRTAGQNEMFLVVTGHRKLPLDADGSPHRFVKVRGWEEA